MTEEQPAASSREHKLRGWLPCDPPATSRGEPCANELLLPQWRLLGCLQALGLGLGVSLAVTDTVVTCPCCLEPAREGPWLRTGEGWDLHGDCGVLLSERRPGGTDLAIKKNGNNLISRAFHLLWVFAEEEL